MGTDSMMCSMNSATEQTLTGTHSRPPRYAAAAAAVNHFHSNQLLACNVPKCVFVAIKLGVGTYNLFNFVKPCLVFFIQSLLILTSIEITKQNAKIVKRYKEFYMS